MSLSAGDSESRPQRLQPELWVVAVAFYGVGDLVTTVIGIRMSGVVEIGPVAGPMLAEYGVEGLLVLKILTIAGGYGVWQLLPAPHRTGVPLGLAVVGMGVTGWNTLIVSTVLLA